LKECVAWLDTREAEDKASAAGEKYRQAYPFQIEIKPACWQPNEAGGGQLHFAGSGQEAATHHCRDTRTGQFVTDVYAKKHRKHTVHLCASQPWAWQRAG
jgi:hypothetical protein